MRFVRNLSVKYLIDQRGITGLETAIVLIAFVVVASVFAFTVLTTGLFTSEETKKASMAAARSTESTLQRMGAFISGGPCQPGSGAFQCGMQSYMVDWSGCRTTDAAGFPLDDGSCQARPQLFRFKLAPAGNTSVEFDPTKTLVTWFDTGSGNSNDPPTYHELLFDKEIVAPDDIDINGNPVCDGTSRWCYQFKAGETDMILDLDEYVEILITGVGGPLHMVEKNSEILVEVITADGAVLQIQGKMPGVVRQTMILDR
jgi:flagellin-like protein